MTHKTRALVLRTVRYGETSVIVTAFTELFGIQAYLVNGVRTSKQGGKLSYYQPGALLDLVVYHTPNKNLQRIKDCQWAQLNTSLFGHVLKNCVALFVVELLLKCLKQPEPNTDLFYFCEDFLSALNEADAQVAANMPLFFALNLAQLLGFQLDATEAMPGMLLDLMDGRFTAETPAHPHVANAEDADKLAELLRVRLPEELRAFAWNQATRQRLLQAILLFYGFHVPDFGELKTLPVLQAVMS